jgi:tRNA nucleotidyltransferase (CCA-adding enzyme)
VSRRRSAPDTLAPPTVVTGHANPDFDSYAATVAATKLFPGAKGVFLGSQNSNVREFHNLHADLLPFVDLKGLDLSHVERVVMVDTRDPGRIGPLGEVAQRRGVEVVVYDHHPPMADDIVGAEDHGRQVGSATSLLVHEIRDRGIPLTALEASLFLIGIHEDTGSLTYPSATSYDAEAVAFLMSSGADMEVVNQYLVRQLTSEQRALLEGLLGTLEVWDIHGQQVAVGWADVDEYVDSASVVTHYLCEDLGYRVAVAVIKMPDRLYLVGRSRLAEVDIAAVLGLMGGGGHAQAASAARRDLDVATALTELHTALEACIRRPMTAGDIASSPVRSVAPDDTMRQAGDVMRRWGHGALPVVVEGRIEGLVTRKDVDKAARHGLEHAPVKGFMNRTPLCVLPDADLPSLERLLTREGIGRVPVCDPEGEITGILTRKDLLRAEHGDAYLDRGLLTTGTASSQTFLESTARLLPVELSESLHVIGSLAEEHGVRAHVVGGFVRDMLLGRPNLDIDIVVEGDGVAFAEEAAGLLGARTRVHRRFGTAVLVLPDGRHLDVASARSEYYARPGALPTVERSSLRQDLLRRDFSVNAMAACIDPDCFGAIADPFGGLKDLEAGRVRVLHTLSFVEDPTRVFRAARFETRYGFCMEPTTEELARSAVDMCLLDEVSGARLREEVLAILDEEPAAQAIGRLQELGALAGVLPAAVDPGAANAAFKATEKALPRLEKMLGRALDREVALSVPLAAGASRANVERWLRRLRLGRKHGGVHVALAEHGDAVAHSLADGRKMRDSRLFGLLGGLPLELLPYLYGTGSAMARRRVERFARELAHIKPAVSGDDLVALGYRPSSRFSEVLRQALADRLDGRAVGRDAELANLTRLAAKARLARGPARPRDKPKK